MYALLRKQFQEEEPASGFTAYTELVRTDPEYKKCRSFLRGKYQKDGELWFDDIMDKAISIMWKRDYKLDKAVNEEAGCVMSVWGYIKRCLVWGYLSVKNEKQKSGYVQSLDDVIGGHSDKHEGQPATLGDYVKDDRAEMRMEEAEKVDIEQVIAEMIHIDRTVCPGYISLVLMMGVDESTKSAVITAIGSKLPTRTQITSGEVYDNIVSLKNFSEAEIYEELENQMAGVSQFKDLIRAISAAQNKAAV